MQEIMLESQQVKNNKGVNMKNLMERFSPLAALLSMILATTE